MITNTTEIEKAPPESPVDERRRLAEDRLLAAFESCALSNEEFHHADHVRMAWLYLERHPLCEALGRFTGALQRFAAHYGAPERYHATITFAYLFLIAERRARRPDLATWDEFAAANADLLRWRGGILERSYRPETLASELARRVFVLPDAPPAPEVAA